MNGLRVYVFGQPRVLWVDSPIQFPTRKTLELLCFLLIHTGRIWTREAIAELFWPMQSSGKARRCLSTTLWRLRQTLSNFSSESYVLAEENTLTFNHNAPYWLDVKVFKDAVQTRLTKQKLCSEQDRVAFEEALILYRGDPIEGCYEDWCLAERERLQLLLIKVLKRLLCYHHRCGIYDLAIEYGQRLLSLDRYQEDVYRELMRCYVETGQRALALEVFNQCREMLSQELRAEPMPETWELLRQIRGTEASHLLHNGKTYTDTLYTVILEVRKALSVLESAWQILEIDSSTTSMTDKVQ